MRLLQQSTIDLSRRWLSGCPPPNLQISPVTANFSEITSYTLSTSANGGGTVSPAAGTHTYTPGTVVNITATPNAGWQFSYWTGDVASNFSASTTVTMNAHKTVIATFMQTGIPVGGEVAPVSAARVLATWLAPLLLLAMAIGGGLVWRRRQAHSARALS